MFGCSDISSEKFPPHSSCVANASVVSSVLNLDWSRSTWVWVFGAPQGQCMSATNERHHGAFILMKQGASAYVSSAGSYQNKKGKP